MAVPDSVAVIQATLAPAFLLSGSGITLNFMQTRLFRVLDRSRAEPSGHATPLQVRRARILRNAIALGVFTVACTVLTALLLMVSQILQSNPAGHAAPYAFSLAMVAFLAALCLVFWDTVLSVRSMPR